MSASAVVSRPLGLSQTGSPGRMVYRSTNGRRPSSTRGRSSPWRAGPPCWQQVPQRRQAGGSSPNPVGSGSRWDGVIDRVLDIWTTETSSTRGWATPAARGSAIPLRLHLQGAAAVSHRFSHEADSAHRPKSAWLSESNPPQNSRGHPRTKRTAPAGFIEGRCSVYRVPALPSSQGSSARSRRECSGSSARVQASVPGWATGAA